MVESEQHLTQSALRALDILEAVGKEGRPIGLSELARRIGLHKSTVYRLVTSLQIRGWLTKEAESGKYRLGIKFLTVLGHGNVGSAFQEIHPLLEQLSEKIHETVILSVWDGREAICVDKVETDQRIQVSSHVGSSFPIYAGGTGWSLLIGMPEETAREVLANTELKPYTERTLTDLQKIMERYHEMKRLGYAVSTGQVDQGVVGIGMPIYFPYEQCYGSVGVVAPEMRVTGEIQARIIKELGRTCDLIRSRLNLR